jgi:hypothetical protein
MAVPARRFVRVHAISYVGRDRAERHCESPNVRTMVKMALSRQRSYLFGHPTRPLVFPGRPLPDRDGPIGQSRILESQKIH